MSLRMQLVGTLVALVVAAPQEGMLQALAKQAKAEGHTTIQVLNPWHRDIVGDTDQEFFGPFSLALVTATSPVMTATKPDEIFSWQRAQLNRMLRNGPQQRDRDFDQPAFCATLPGPAGLGPRRDKQLEIVSAGGTAVIDGIQVTIGTIPAIERFLRAIK